MFLSGGFKDNKHLEMGVMTGVLRVAKEGILSGLNNLGVWSVFESEFSEFFGFTEEEVQKMADYFGVPEKLAEIKTWYDGYDFGGREIYNPWSVLNYFSRSCTSDLYWLNTSANDIIIQLIKCFPHNFAKTIEALLEGKDVRVPMAKEIGPYREVINRPDTLYSLLVATGYLKVLTPIDENGRCQVSLPNHEISKVFISEIQSKLNQHLLVQTDAIIDAFLD